MYDLQRLNGSFKGTIAECAFKLTNEKVVITKFFNKRKYMDIFGKYFTEEQRVFLEENWFSIDAIEIKFEDRKKHLILYEIKSKNAFYANRKDWPFQITANSYKIYKNSMALGFEPKFAAIWYFKDWKFDVDIRDFESAHLAIDKPDKVYDKK
jgi:hypothetical protein